MPGAEVKTGTPHSCALLCNNLTANGKHLAYAAYTKAVIVPDGQCLRGGNAIAHCASIESEEGAQIQQLRWVQLQMQEFLVIATTKNLMIYSAGGERLIHVVTASSGESANDAPAAFRGIGSCVAGPADYICVGVSTGAVCLVPVPNPAETAFGDSLLSPTSEDAIVDVTAGQAPHNDPTRALVCSADSVGSVLVHALEADGMWQHCCAFNCSTYDETPSLCTTLRMRGNYIYAGYSTGHIRVFDLVACAQVVQVAAHARWINALEVHPDGTTFASAGEDTTINVWAFHAPPQVVHKSSIVVTDSLLTGLAFCGGLERSHMCANAYDQPTMHAWKLDL